MDKIINNDNNDFVCNQNNCIYCNSNICKKTKIEFIEIYQNEYMCRFYKNNLKGVNKKYF